MHFVANPCYAYTYRSVGNAQVLALARPRGVAIRRDHPLGTGGRKVFSVAGEKQPRVLHLDDGHGLLVARPLKVGGLPRAVVSEVHRHLDPRHTQVLLRLELPEDEEAEHLRLELGLLDVDVRRHEGAQPGELGNVPELVRVDVHPLGNGLLDDERASLGKRHCGEHELNLSGKLSGSVKGVVKEYIFLGLCCMSSQTRRFMLITNITSS